ncbi:hypothetical protein BV898_08266 [Hypsibius exemplaris]|uniref:G-protein coupled receptors family 1 profile domain-containing protein n=1 Tax=Hypsibius exemplaris TaxID=2072580 RepID=A0A1W0WR29_HYPEX|nr:hypothetical protein BV898_08266 [Hypsibius exemplaris]
MNSTSGLAESLANITALNPNTNITVATAQTELVASWTLAPIVALLTFIFGCLGNGLLLLLFIKDSTLHTPFNMYLINLLLANLACLLIQYPLEFLFGLYKTWFMGGHACTAYIYGYFVMQAAVKNAHQLIAINRIWAIIHPLSYRTYHSTKFAVLFCLGMWIYVHLALVQGWVADALYYRLPVKEVGCFLNAAAQPIMKKVTVLLIYDLPLVVMILAFPIIQCAKTLRRNVANRKNVVAPNGDTHLVRVSDGIKMNSKMGANIEAPAKPAILVKRVKQNSNGYLVLVFLTISAIICWAPINSYHIMIIYFEITPPLVFHQVATILFSCQCVLDPVLFTLALSSIKNSLRRTFRCCGSPTTPL